MILGASASLSSNASLMATVGLLYGELMLMPKTTNALSAQIAVDSLNLQGIPTVKLVGGGAFNAQMNLTANLGLGSGGATGEFPSISTTISMNWSDLTNPGNSSPILGRHRVLLDLGSFDKHLGGGPSFRTFQQYTEPFQGAINFLNTPIPGIDQVFSGFSLMTVLQIVAGQTGYGPLETAFQDVTSIISLIDNLGDGLNGVTFNFGSFGLNSSAILNAPAAADPSELASDLSANLSSLDASATSGDLSGSAQGLIAGFAGTLASKISGLTLPGGTPIGADAANLLNTLAEAVTGVDLQRHPLVSVVQRPKLRPQPAFRPGRSSDRLQRQLGPSQPFHREYGAERLWR